MSGQHERTLLPGGGEQRVEVGDVIDKGVRLRHRGRHHAVAFEFDVFADRRVGAIVEADAREFRDRRIDGRVELFRLAASGAEGVMGQGLDRIVRRQRVGPDPARFPAPGNQHDGRRPGSAALDIHLALRRRCRRGRRHPRPSPPWCTTPVPGSPPPGAGHGASRRVRLRSEAGGRGSSTLAFAASWRATCGRRRDERFDHGLERGEHGEECFAGAAIAVHHQGPYRTGAGVVLDVGGISRLRPGVTEGDHPAGVGITLDADAEFVIQSCLAKRRRQAETLSERDAPGAQIGQGRGERAGRKRDLRPPRRVGARRQVRAEVGIAAAERRLQPAMRLVSDARTRGGAVLPRSADRARLALSSAAARAARGCTSGDDGPPTCPRPMRCASRSTASPAPRSSAARWPFRRRSSSNAPVGSPAT